MGSRIKLKFGDIILEVKDCLEKKSIAEEPSWPYLPFVYKGKRYPEISLEVKRGKSPANKYLKKIFSTIHPVDKKVVWRLFSSGNKFVVKIISGENRLEAVLGKKFDKGIILLKSSQDSSAWDLQNFCDIFQIVLINYLARQNGIMVHSVGLKDHDEAGLLFAGPSRSGKSTTAQIWSKNSPTKVMNDDRIIVRKINGEFYIFATPWHGDAKKIFNPKRGRIKLNKVFFIYHRKENDIRALDEKGAFYGLYPNIFLSFWSPRELKKQGRICSDIAKNVPCYEFGFKKDKSIIKFVKDPKNFNIARKKA
jgi:hypothetical protein